MGIIKILKNLRNNFVINQVEQAYIPEFEPDKIVRYHMIFSGKVQGVGFRIVVGQLALRLDLTGWVRNLDSGGVEMEIQGMENKINHLIEYMNSITRIKINKIEKEIMPVVVEEEEFSILY